MFGYQFDLTAEEQKQHGLSQLLVYQETGTGNGWVLNTPENRHLAGDIILLRSNPHYGVEGRSSSKNRFTHTLTDLHNAGRAVKSHRDNIEHEIDALRLDVALISLVQQHLSDWNQWSESDRALYSSIMEMVGSGHQRALDPAKQRALEQLLGSRDFTDSLNRANPGMVSWRLPVAKERLVDRANRVNEQFASNSRRRAWINQCWSDETKRVDQLLELMASCDNLAEREGEFLERARSIRFKPYVQAVNLAWHNIAHAQSAYELSQSLMVMGGLYGVLMRPMSIIAHTTIKQFESCIASDLNGYIELINTLELLLPQIGVNSAYQQLAGQLTTVTAAVKRQLQDADFQSAIQSARDYRMALRYHGLSKDDWGKWYLAPGMEWPSTLPKDFDPFKF